MPACYLLVPYCLICPCRVEREGACLEARVVVVKVLILGVAQDAMRAVDWDGGLFDYILVIEEAWHLRPDWTHMLHSDSLAPDDRPVLLEAGQQVVTEADYEPVLTHFGGAAYTGSELVLAASYWALAALEPAQIFCMGCEFDAPGASQSHGARDLTAKARRLEYFASLCGCAIANLSSESSVLPFQRATFDGLDQVRPAYPSEEASMVARQLEQQYGDPASPNAQYPCAQGMAEIDAAWRRCFILRDAAVA